MSDPLLETLEQPIPTPAPAPAILPAKELTPANPGPIDRLVRTASLAQALKNGPLPAPEDVKADPELAPYGVYKDCGNLYMKPEPKK